jgi:hypothetical protein
MGVDPVSAGLALAGTGLSAFCKYESGQATQATMAYQAQVAQNNAIIAKQNARWDMQAGEAAASAQGLKTRAQVGSTVAKTAAGGVATGVGSAADTVAGEREVGLINAMTIRSNASREAYGQEVQATSDTAQAQLDTMEGSQAAEGGDLGAIGSLLSGASTTGKFFPGGNLSKYLQGVG